MVYVNADGNVGESRSPWRISIVSDFFWGVVNFVGLFVDTLINPRKAIPRRAVGNGDTSSGSGASNYRSDTKHNLMPRRPDGMRSNVRTLPKNCNTGS
jgi:hypothetical protein